MSVRDIFFVITILLAQKALVCLHYIHFTGLPIFILNDKKHIVKFILQGHEKHFSRFKAYLTTNSN